MQMTTRLAYLTAALFGLLSLPSPELHAASEVGVPISYELPADGPLPKTYRVTLAIVDAKNPDWIVSQFACGVARTVTKENGGKFSETWDGLDDNFMPVPPGDYAVKGILMPAREWVVDKEWHTVTPRFVTGASTWLPSPAEWQVDEPFSGDPVNAPVGDIAVGENGVAVFYWSYLENGTNNPMFDLKKPPGLGQFIRSFPSGGAGGGTATATDGETVWSFCNEGGMKYVYRADQQSFGKSEGANRRNGYVPDGWVTSMAAWRNGGDSFVAVAQRGKIIEKKQGHYSESPTEFANKITLHDGRDGKLLGEISIDRPRSVTVRDGVLYALHAEGEGSAVSAVGVGAGAAEGKWERVFAVPADIKPFDMKVDGHGRFYLSDEAANHVYQLSRAGKVLLTIGKLDGQKPGSYDPLTLMAPGKLATWADPEGQDRILIVENAGPNRIAEWGADGKLIREFLTLQTKANDGYMIDPEHPTHVYIPGQQGWLTRFRVDYEKGTWTTDAVWPLPEDPRAHGLTKPRLVRTHGGLFFAGAAGAREDAFNVFRLGDDGLKLSAAIMRQRTEVSKPGDFFLWHDANGDGRVGDDEMNPTTLPGFLFTYHGQNWSDDLSFLAMGQGSRSLWELAPAGFDAHGNPIFKEWQKLLTDPMFTARAEGTADALHGGNELADKFESDWMQTDGTRAGGFYVQARGGPNFSANAGPQHKISRYVPDGNGGFQLKWRTGRTAMQRNASPGEVYGAMRIRKPVNGLLSVIDQSRCGVLLFNEDGLYVDTVFPDEHRVSRKDAGLYVLPGEFFVGDVFGNRENGKIYFAMGKDTPLIFEAEGWSLTENPARPLTTLQRKVNIAAAQIATPPDIALSVRGGAGVAKYARFAPALGDVALDGSMSGWESSEPVRFQADKDQTVEVRCLYRPEQIFLRWHARMPGKFEPKPLPPLARIFTHDQLADTLSFYIQGDPNAKPNGAPGGRPGDVRFVFGVFGKGGAPQPVGVGMYPQWSGPAKPSPQIYRTPVGVATFAHVGAVEGAQLFHKTDDDGKGFVFVGVIPRTAIPQMKTPFAGGLRTLVNFEATFAGHSKFWWANSDGSASRETYDEPTEARLYPGSWAPADFQGLDHGVLVQHWLRCGPFGGPGAEKFKDDPNGVIAGTTIEMKKAVREFCEAATYPPDSGMVDLDARYTGDQVRGYWKDPGEVRWKSASTNPLDTRITLGGGGQVWYGATWVYAPAATEVEFQFQNHPMSYPRWTLNGEAVPLKPADFQGADNRPIAKRTLTLRAGWNEVRFRSYCAGYSPFRAGLILNAPPVKLWTLKLSTTPPGLFPTK